MLGASIAATTADSSTSHIREILRFTESGMSRSAADDGIGLDTDLPQGSHRVLGRFGFNSPLGPM